MFPAVLLALATIGAPGARIEVWTRAPGDFAKYGDIDHLAVLYVDLAKLPATIRKQEDVHYRRVVELRGVDLRTLIEQNHREGTDRALLHFANGVRIPIEVNAGADALPLFLASAINVDGAWTNRFPEAPRELELYVDSRPIKFGANKVSVVAKGDDFTPWRHADTLIGIEYVKGDAYDRQFAMAKGEQGMKIFLESCQFCHAVEGIGGHLGWDFVRPLPVYEYRETPKSLYYHVNFRSEEAAASGLLMPVPRKLTMDEAKVLWTWLRDLEKTPRPAYAP